MAIHIRRREFIVTLGSAAVGWPLRARAQQAAKVPRVGILSPAASETAATLTAFREGIREFGYIEGQTIALDFRLSRAVQAEAVSAPDRFLCRQFLVPAPRSVDALSDLNDAISKCAS